MLFRRLISILAVLTALTGAAYGQGAPLQAGPPVAGHVPVYVGPSNVPVITDGGTAAGGGTNVGPSELGLTIRGSGTPPFANAGTGPFNTNFCSYDAPVTSATGYHYLCLGPNSQGGGMLAYGAGGIASQLPFTLNINGVSTTLPGGACTFCGSIATQNANNVAITGGTISNVTLNGNLTFAVGGDLTGNLPNPTFNLSNAHAWVGQQTFALPPIFTTLTGYIKGAGVGQATAAATVPTTDLSGSLQAAQEPAHTGDVTNTAGSLGLTIGTGIVTNTKLATMVAGTIKANITGGLASPTDVTFPGLLNAFVGSSAGTLIFNNGSTWTGLPIGTTAGQILTIVNGLPSWQPVPTGTRQLVNTINAAGLPNIQDTYSLGLTGFTEFEIDIENFVPSTSNALCQLTVQFGGSFVGSGYAGAYRDSTTSATAMTAATTSIPCSAAVSNVANNGGVLTRFFLHNPASTTTKMTFNGSGSSQSDSAPSQHIFDSYGRYDTIGPITGYQIAFSAGTITSGVVKVYAW